MDGSNLIFIVMAIAIGICPFTGVAPALTAGSHSPGLPWDADRPGRTKRRPNPGQASSDPGGTEIPAASVAWVNSAMARDARTRARLEQHWVASERGDIDTEHAIYAEDAFLDYPQSGERFRGA